MPRHSKLTTADLAEVRTLFTWGLKPNAIAKALRERGIIITGAAIHYHLGLRKVKVKPELKDYEYFLRRDCKRRGVRFERPTSREKRLWS